MVEEILEEAETAAREIQDFDGRIRLVGQYDADGICATAIACEMLSRLGKDFEYEILKQLYDEDIERLADEDEDLILFVDIGSGKAGKVEEVLSGEKQVIVSDHHSPEQEGSFTHLNPHFLGHDGGEAISAAGMTYLLAEAISDDNRNLVDLALIGATGDVQKQEGEFLGLNQQLLERAEKEGLVERRQGLDLYGRSTKPLHKSLMYTSDPHLEGITGSESGAIQFLKSAGIDLRENGDFRTLEDLDEAEEKQLIHELIKEGHDVEPLLRDIYTLENSYGIDEFSTVINACGRLGEAETGVKILLEDDLELAEKISRKYGRKISSALSFVEDNRNDEEKIWEDSIGVIDAGSSIDEEFIGTVTTITMSDGLFSSPVVAGLAEADKDKIKVSSRASKEAVEEGLNLGEVMGEICEEVDGEGGGHNVAAGAKIPRDKKQTFIEQLEEEIGERV